MIFYFILSIEINAYIKQVKMVFSQKAKILISETIIKIVPAAVCSHIRSCGGFSAER